MLQVLPEGQSVREVLHQPHTLLSSGGRLRLRCPLRQGRPRRRGRVGPHPRTPGRDRAAAGLLGTTAADEQRSRNVAESTHTVRCQGTDQAQASVVGRRSAERQQGARPTDVGVREHPSSGVYVARTENGPNFRYLLGKKKRARTLPQPVSANT